MVMGPVIDYWEDPCSPMRNRTFSSDKVVSESFAAEAAKQKGADIPRLPRPILPNSFVLISHSVLPRFHQTLPLSIALTESDFIELGGSGYLRITDDLSMLTGTIDLESAATEAWISGANMVLIGNDYQQFPSIIGALSSKLHLAENEGLSAQIGKRAEILLGIRRAIESKETDKAYCFERLHKSDYLEFARKMLRSSDDMQKIKVLIKSKKPDLFIATSRVSATIAARYVPKVLLSSSRSGTYDALLSLQKNSIAIIELTQSYIETWKSIIGLIDPSITIVILIPDSMGLYVPKPLKGGLIYSSSLTSTAREALVEAVFDEQLIKTTVADKCR